jgi:hypothetical protein
VSLKELESWLKRGQKVPFLREICSPDKCTPKIGANIGAITGILLSRYGLITVKVRLIQSNLCSFSLIKKTRVLERGCIVAKRGQEVPF